MKKLFLILLVAILVMAVFVPTALADDVTDGGAEIVSSDESIDVWGYIKPEVYILIPALYVVGLFLKKIPKIPDWLIPIALLILGVIGAPLIVGGTVYGFIQGVLCAGAAVFGNQLYKQTANGIESMRN